MSDSDSDFQDEVEKQPGAPVWIISFADMSLLLLCFMIMLLSKSAQSSSTEEDMLKVLASVKIGFGYVPRAGSTDPVDIAVQQILALELPTSFESQTLWPTPPVRGQLYRPGELRTIDKGLIGRPVLFEPGSVHISPKMQTYLDEIAEAVRHRTQRIVIKGHTSPQEADVDPSPQKIVPDPDKGRYLAYQRTLAVKRALVKRGIAESRLYLVSCAYFDAEEEQGPLQRRAVVTLGEYFVPGNKQADSDRRRTSEDE